MLWNKALFVLISAALASAATLTPPTAVAPPMDELLTYECARSVATMVDGSGSEQMGPVFSQGTLVFSSVTTADGGRVLIASAGAGTFAVPLDRAGVNRIRFELPTNTSSKTQMFYLSYLHDSAFRSRVFEFSMQKAPAGHDDIDYALVQPTRAAYLLPHLEYAIWETSESELNAVTEGIVRRDQVSKQKADCEHLTRRSPVLARGLRRNLDELETMAGGLRSNVSKAAAVAAVAVPTSGGRMPASVPSSFAK